MKNILLLLLLVGCTKETIQPIIPDKITILSVKRLSTPLFNVDTITCLLDNVTNHESYRINNGYYPTLGATVYEGKGNSGDTIYIVSRGSGPSKRPTDFHFIIIYKKDPNFPFRDQDTLSAKPFYL